MQFGRHGSDHDKPGVRDFVEQLQGHVALARKQKSGAVGRRLASHGIGLRMNAFGSRHFRAMEQSIDHVGFDTAARGAGIGIGDALGSLENRRQ